MPHLIQENEPIKLLLLGNSGAGKTGLFGTLAKDYRLFIADFDNGTQILLDPAVVEPSLHENIFVKKYYDKALLAGGKIVPNATGYSNFISDLGDWKEDGKSMGGIYSWSKKDIFIVDSLTFLGTSILNHILQLAGRAGQKPQLQDFGAAIDAQEAVIETLYNPAVSCNIIVTAHLQMQADEAQGNILKAMPSAIGKKLPPKIARYFNNVVLIQKTGFGDKVKREIITTATHNTDLKVAKPSLIPAVLSPDLALLFKLLQTESK